MSNIKFIEDTHQYISDGGLELISVSAFTERFKEKLDWNEIARKKAVKLTKAGEPTTTEELLQKWERKRILASQIGSAYHLQREDELIAELSPVFYNSLCNVQGCTYEGVDKWSIPINNLQDNTIYPELMIYDLDHLICGQADKVIVVKKKINVWDYKTDEKIKYEAYSSKWVSAEKLLPPVSHLDNCNFNVYSLKMSLYMYMLWKANKGKLKVGDLILEHIELQRDPDNDNLPVLKDGKPIILGITKIKLPYRKKEVMDMLATLK